MLTVSCNVLPQRDINYIIIRKVFHGKIKLCGTPAGFDNRDNNSAYNKWTVLLLYSSCYQILLHGQSFEIIFIRKTKHTLAFNVLLSSTKINTQQTFSANKSRYGLRLFCSFRNAFIFSDGYGHIKLISFDIEHVTSRSRGLSLGFTELSAC